MSALLLWRCIGSIEIMVPREQYVHYRTMIRWFPSHFRFIVWCYYHYINEQNIEEGHVIIVADVTISPFHSKANIIDLPKINKQSGIKATFKNYFNVIRPLL